MPAVESREKSSHRLLKQRLRKYVSEQKLVPLKRPPVAKRIFVMAVRSVVRRPNLRVNNGGDASEAVPAILLSRTSSGAVFDHRDCNIDSLNIEILFRPCQLGKPRT